MANNENAELIFEQVLSPAAKAKAMAKQEKAAKVLAEKQEKAAKVLAEKQEKAAKALLAKQEKAAKALLAKQAKAAKTQKKERYTIEYSQEEGLSIHDTKKDVVLADFFPENDLARSLEQEYMLKLGESMDGIQIHLAGKTLIVFDEGEFKLTVNFRKRLINILRSNNQVFTEWWSSSAEC